MRRLVLLALIWGWSFLFIKVAVGGMTPFTVAWARLALGATVLHVVLRRRRGRVPLDRTALRHFALAATAGNVVPFSLLAYAEQHITSALTAVLNASTPLFTALFAALALSERLRAVQVAGLAVGLTGVAVASGLGTGDLEGASTLATLAGAGAGVGYGVGFVYMRRHLVDLPPLVAATGQLSAGAVLLAAPALGSSLTGGVDLTPTRVAAVALLGAVGTGLAFVLNYGVVAELGATAASLVTYLVPVVAVVVGITVLGETFTWRAVLGGGLAVAGIAVVNHGRVLADARRDQPPVRATADQSASP